VIEVPKNTLETIRFQITEFRGKTYADLRVYYRDDNDELRPTRKGLCVNPELWPDFLKGIEQLGAELEERGLLDMSREAETKGEEANDSVRTEAL